MISDHIKNAVDYSVTVRQNEKNNLTPSSIIKLGVGGEVEILRR